MNIKISNSHLTATINLKGAELTSVVKNSSKRNYLWEGNPKYWAKHAPILFPIVGTLKDNCYTYKETTYQLSRHGFARDMNFELIHHTESEAHFSLQFSTETLLVYPFEFELQVKYTLVDNKLVIGYHVTNNSICEMPFSIGGHPAFALAKNIENYSLFFKDDSKLTSYTLKNDLLSEEKQVIELKNKSLALHYNLFVKDALVIKSMNSKSITLMENEKPILHFNFQDFPNFGIWTKQNAPFICLEPWLGYADTDTASGNIKVKEAIQLLQVNCSKEFCYSIEIL